MSYYEFECADCHRSFTVQQTYREHDEHRPVKCPVCGSTKTQQVVSNVHVMTSKKS